MKKIFLLLIVLSIPFHYACREIKVTYSESGKTVHMAVDQILKVELPGNTSTGNDWRQIAYNDSVIIRQGKPNYMLADDRMGSPGVYYFRFKAIAAGSSKLVMEYGSKYDSKKEALKTFELDIVIVQP